MQNAVAVSGRARFPPPAGRSPVRLALTLNERQKSAPKSIAAFIRITVAEYFRRELLLVNTLRRHQEILEKK